MSPSDCRPCSPLLSLPVDSMDGQPVQANTASVECVGVLTASNLITKRTVASVVYSVVKTLEVVMSISDIITIVHVKHIHTHFTLMNDLYRVILR